MVFTKHTSVNLQRFANEIDEFVVDELMDVELEWNDLIIRDQSVDLFEILMREYQIDGYVDNFSVYSNYKNNTIEDELLQKFQLTIEFKQRNCLNRTHLNYRLGTGYKE